MKKLLIISTSKEFCNDWVNKLSKQFKVTWGQHDLISEEKLLSVLNTDSWDILAISPDPLKWEIPESFYSSLGKIKHVCLPTTSYECFDAKRLKKMGIALSNIPHYSTNAVAEWALFMMLGLLRRISSVIKADFNHKYTDENLAAEFEGKTAGIIGLGAIGTKISQLLSGLGLKVIYWSPYTKNSKFLYKPLEEVLKTADFIFPTYKIKTDTKSFLNKEKLSLIRSSSYIVNIAGETAWDTEQVIKMTQDNKLAGAAFESTSKNLKDYSGNLFILPPLGWYTKESQLRTFQIWYDNIISCLRTKPKNIVTE